MGLVIIAWLKENKDRLLTFVGILLVGVLAFEAGLLKGHMREVKPLTLSIPPVVAEETEKGKGSSVTLSPLGSVQKGIEPIVSVASTQKDCPFVGSKNSNKYHLPTCAAAKRIKPENKVCFSSHEVAKSRGYIAGCLN